MRKLIILSFFQFLLFQGSQAQHVLESSDYKVELGASYILHQTGYLAPITGNSTIWDYSALKIAGSNAISVIDVADSPFASDFPKANICYDYGNGNYIYAFQDDTQYVREGGVAKGTSIPMSDSQTLFKFPLQIGDSYSDAFASDFSVKGVDFHRDGQLHVQAEAMGTLVMPYGVVTEVMRIRVTEEIKDSYQVVDEAAAVHTVNQSYLYVKAGMNEVLLTLTQASRDGQELASYGTMLESSVVSDRLSRGLPLRNLAIAPNPTSGDLRIQFISEWEGTLALDLLDMNGKLIQKEVSEFISVGPIEKELSLDTIPAGSYLLRLQLADHQTLTKVMKE